MVSQTLERTEVMTIIEQGGVIAIIRLDDLGQVLELSRTLLTAGITALEFTLTNPAALSVLREVKEVSKVFGTGEAVIGAGTVLNAQAATEAIEAGAQFIVAPSINFGTIEVCLEKGVAMMPGALTPTEIMVAYQAGVSAIKVFPARSFGPAYLKDLREPLPFLKLIPTGGVNLQNVGNYIQNGASAVGVGGNLVDRQLIAQQDWVTLGQNAAAYITTVQQARSPK